MAQRDAAPPGTGATEVAPLHVLLVSPGGISGRGGIQSMARYLSEGLEHRPGITCTTLDPYGRGGRWSMPFHFLAALLRIPGFARRPRTVAHINMSFGASALRKLLLLRWSGAFGIPVVLHLHGSEFALFCDRLSPRLRRLLVRSMERADRIIVIGGYWRDYLTGTLHISPGKIAVVHNGVPLPEKLERRATGEPCRIVSLGRLGRRKGTPDLLRALASQHLSPIAWQAVLAGNGPVEEYRREAAELGLAPRVDLPGWMSPAEAQTLLARTDIFTLPSWNEGLPVAILEAMAAGIPVVSTPVGAISDLVLEGETGFLVPPGDVDQLADRLARLVTDPLLRARLGAAGRSRVEAGFTIEHSIDRYVAIYRELLDR